MIQNNIVLMNIYYLYDKKKKLLKNKYFSSELCFLLSLIIYFASNTLVF